jgi:glycosyltransferase involved in cell wall biosynthesis
MPAMTDAGMPPCFANWFRFILGNSTGIICVSRATADDVDMMIRAIRLPRPMKIGYIQLGADFTDGPADDAWITPDGEDPLFLMVGTIEPRKGHALVLDAFDRHWAAGGKGRLLLIGKAGWNTRLLELRLRHHPQLGKRLLLYTNVSDAQLRGPMPAPMR